MTAMGPISGFRTARDGRERREQDAPRICERALTGSGVWSRDQLDVTDWLMPVSTTVLSELDVLVDILRNHPMETIALDWRDYPLAASAAMMRQVRTVLDQGAGFVVLDRLPVDRYTRHELRQVYWLLSSMIARPVAQSFDGRLLYDVTDTGARIDTRVRGDVTRQELSWHTDYGFNFPPPYIGLLALRVAVSGGTSRVASLLTAHNRLRQQDPGLLERLYRPFWWNRQGEHGDGDSVAHFYPVYTFDGNTVRGRFIKWLLYKGYELMGETFDADGRNAIDAMFAILNRPENHLGFQLEAGQIQYMNNFRIVHCRSEYEDADDADARRHLVRIFLRDGGRRSFMG